MCTILTCLYLTLNLGAMDGLKASDPAHYDIYLDDGRRYVGTVSIPQNYSRDITDRSGTLGIVEIGTEVSLNRWLSINALVRHQSFTSTGHDHGENIVAGGFKIMPFRR